MIETTDVIVLAFSSSHSDEVRQRGRTDQA